MSGQVTGTLTLTDGTVVSLTWARKPKHWKSVLLSQLPYGTDTVDSVFTLADAS